MVANLAELATGWAYAEALGSAGYLSALNEEDLAPHGQVLIRRASTLVGVTLGTRGIPGINGTPLYLAESSCRNSRNCFLANRVFAVVRDDGSLCLRLPKYFADDLVENGLCVFAGKNLMTWPAYSDYQREVNWRILLHAYWHVTGSAPKRTRKLWSEWVIRH